MNAEIRSWMGRRGLTQKQLAEATGISKSKLSRILGSGEQAKQSMDTDELDLICQVLEVSPAQVVDDAVSVAMRPNLDVQTGYDLAAQKKRQLRPGEEAGIEYFD